MLSATSKDKVETIHEDTLCLTKYGAYGHQEGLWSTGPSLPPPSMVLLGTALIRALSGCRRFISAYRVVLNSEKCHYRCQVKGGYSLVFA